MSPQLLSISGMSVTYFAGKNGTRTPIAGFDINVSSEELIVILGDSGVGKSTLLHFVAGFLRPATELAEANGARRWFFSRTRAPLVKGRISILDEDVSSMEPWTRDVSLVMQRFNLYPHMTVARNLEFPLRFRGIPRRQRREQVEEMARDLGIEDQLSKLPRELSGGQQQRVAIGKSLLRNPSVVLMDEPFSHLDWKWRRNLRSLLFERLLDSQRKQRCVLLVTHDFEDAHLASRIVLMEESTNGLGARVQVFPREAGLAHPGSAWKQFQQVVERAIPGSV